MLNGIPIGPNWTTLWTHQMKKTMNKTAETLSEALVALKNLGCFRKHEYINQRIFQSKEADGIVQFQKYVSSNPDLVLEIDFGTDNPEEPKPELAKTIRLGTHICTAASRILVWEPAKPENPPIINYINRAF